MIANTIPERREHNIQDSTKITKYKACPRRYFYEFVLGWRPDYPNHDLYFGQSFHLAMEYMYEKQRQRNTPGYDEADVVRAWAIFNNHYRQVFTPDTDAEHGSKTPVAVMEALLDYIQHYAADTFTVDYAEVSGSVPISRDRVIYFRLDAVITESDGRKSILDHKTSRWDKRRWSESLVLCTQAGTALHVLRSMFGEKAGRMIYNGIFLYPKGAEFLRQPVEKTNNMMLEWLHEVNHYYDSIERDFETLTGEDAGDAYMKSFPRNDTACMQYGRLCPYWHFCMGIPNPLQLGASPQPGFKVEHWDPTQFDSDYTKKVEL